MKIWGKQLNHCICNSNQQLEKQGTKQIFLVYVFPCLAHKKLSHFLKSKLLHNKQYYWFWPKQLILKCAGIHLSTRSWKPSQKSLTLTSGLESILATPRFTLFFQTRISTRLQHISAPCILDGIHLLVKLKAKGSNIVYSNRFHLGSAIFAVIVLNNSSLTHKQEECSNQLKCLKNRIFNLF